MIFAWASLYCDGCKMTISKLQDPLHVEAPPFSPICLFIISVGTWILCRPNGL